MKLADLHKGDYIVTKDGRVGRIADMVCGDPECRIRPYHVRLAFDRQPKVVWVDIRNCGYLPSYDPNIPFASEVQKII